MCHYAKRFSLKVLLYYVVRWLGNISFLYLEFLALLSHHLKFVLPILVNPLHTTHTIASSPPPKCTHYCMVFLPIDKNLSVCIFQRDGFWAALIYCVQFEKEIKTRKTVACGFFQMKGNWRGMCSLWLIALQTTSWIHLESKGKCLMPVYFPAPSKKEHRFCTTGKKKLVILLSLLYRDLIL